MKCRTCGFTLTWRDTKECPQCLTPPTSGAPDSDATVDAGNLPRTQGANSSYSRYCKHCGAKMAGFMQFCPICRQSKDWALEEKVNLFSVNWHGLTHLIVGAGLIAGMVGIILFRGLADVSESAAKDSADESSSRQRQTVIIDGDNAPVRHASTASANRSGTVDKPSMAPIPQPASAYAITGSINDLALETASSVVKNGGFAKIQTIKGTIVNRGPRAFRSVEVEIELCDEWGNRMGSTTDSVDNLAPYGRWNFEVKVAQAGAQNFKVTKISAL